MFQRILISAALLAVVGCAHQPGGSSVTTVVPAAPAGPQETFLGPNDRNPAGEPRIYWRSATKSYDVKSTGLSVTDDFNVQQIMEWETRIPVVRTRLVPGWVIDTDAICEGYQCSGGGGKSAAWNAYFSAPKEQKDDRLADAIKGVGAATAKKLVAGGYFKSKPRSWQAFVDEIDRAVSSGTIEKGVRYQVVVQYRYENMINLGYSANDCQSYTYRCEKVVWGLVPEQYPDVDVRTESRVQQERHRKVNLAVRDPKLQSFESEVVNLTVGEGPQDVQISNSGYTKYSAPRVSSNANGDTDVEIVGQERIPVDLPSEAYVSNEFKVLGGKPTLTVRVNPKYIGQGSQTDSLVVSYYVQTCKLAWLLPGCGMNPWANSDVKYVPVHSTETAIEVPIQKGFKSQVQFRLFRKNSQWYNDKPLFEVASDQVSVK